MITCSYDLVTIEEAFDVALKIGLTLKTLVNVKARCSKHYDYQCPSVLLLERTSESSSFGTIVSTDPDSNRGGFPALNSILPRLNQ